MTSSFIKRALICSCLLFSQVVQSATKTWDGGDATRSLWSAGTNWDSDIAPSATDYLILSGTTRLSNTNDFADGTIFSGIQFDATAGAFSLYGNRIQSTGGITNLSTSLQTIYYNSVVSNSTINCASGAVWVAGVYSNSTTTNIFTKSGTNMLTFSGTSYVSRAEFVQDGVTFAPGSVWNIAGATQPTGTGIVVSAVTGASLVVNNASLISTANGIQSAGGFIIGNNHGGAGTGSVIQLGGSVNMGNPIRIALFTNAAYGSYVVSNGFITLSDRSNSFIQVARDGVGSFYQRDSTVTIARAMNVNTASQAPDPGSAGIPIAFNASGKGTYTVDGGVLNITNQYSYTNAGVGRTGIWCSISIGVTGTGTVAIWYLRG